VLLVLLNKWQAFEGKEAITNLLHGGQFLNNRAKLQSGDVTSDRSILTFSGQSSDKNTLNNVQLGYLSCKRGNNVSHDITKKDEIDKHNV